MNMKYFTKFLCLFLGAAMMLTMAACGSKSDTDANAGADGEKSSWWWPPAQTSRPLILILN